MDKLRAIEYLLAAVDEGSLTGAARRLEVSTPAVQKLLGTLEKNLGTTLFERTSRGIQLTPDGIDYVDSCRPLLDGLNEAEHALRQAANRPRGTLVVAAHEQLVHHLLLPSLPAFHARFPELELDIRTIHRITDADANQAGILLLHGWPTPAPDFVHRQFPLTRSIIVAAPSYWSEHGVPTHPIDLGRHNCLAIRNPAGIVIDLWEFTRCNESCSVKVNGWISSNSREVLLDLAIRGQGVARFTELTTMAQINAGRLVPVLRDWEVQGGPPTNLLYRASAKRYPKTRVFIDFINQILVQTQTDGLVAKHPSAALPSWHKRGYGRASATKKFT